IEAHIRERLARNEDLRDVRVVSSGGVVQLEGVVLKGAQRQIVERVAQGAPGVVAVENRVEISQDLRERTLPALEQAGDKLRRILGALPLLLIGLLIFLVFAL